MPHRRPPELLGAGFLISQLGSHAATAFAASVAPLGLTPPHVGLLRSIAVAPGRSQQLLADEFGMLASRMVMYVDDLEQRGLVERRRDDHDRRVHLLHLTATGEELMRELAAVGAQAERRLLRSLSTEERKQLALLLRRVADDQGLRPGIHPGYGRLRPDRGHPQHNGD